MTTPIFVISGPPASGKSTLALALLRRFPYGFHIPVDSLRNCVVTGLSDPIGSWDAETERQFRLARQGAVRLARLYAEAGFAVAIDDVITPEHFQAHYAPHFGNKSPHAIMLLPKVEIALSRNAQRRKDVDTSQLSSLISTWHRHVSQYNLSAMGWQILDSSDLSVEETISEILTRVMNFEDLFTSKLILTSSFHN